MKRIVALAVLLAFGSAMVASAADAKENWEKQCAKCHGKEGKGDTKMGQKLGVKDLTDAKVQSELDGEVVGQCGLPTFPNRPRRRHVGQLGMAVREDWQGQGVGTALMLAAIELAEKWLNLSRLELDVYTDNAPAIKLYRNFGFTIEGTAIHYAFRDGQFVDVYLMARLREPKS